MKLRYLLILLVSIASLVILGSQFNWRDLGSALTSMHAGWMIPGVLVYLLSLLARTLRWRIMAQGVKSMKISRLTQYVTIGFMTNNLLPARLGEVVRAYVAGKVENTSRSALFATIVLERICDGLTIVALFVLTLFITGRRHPLLLNVAWMSAVLFICGFCFLLLLTYRRDLALRLARLMARVLPLLLREKLIHILEKFVNGLALLHHPADFFKVLLWSVGVWGLEFLVYVVYREAFPGVDVSLEVLIIAMVFVNLSAMLPALPANALVFQVACSQALIIFGGVEQSTALLYSVVIHASQIFPTIIIGYVFMGLLGLTWRELRHVELEEGNNVDNDDSSPQPTP